MHWALSDNLPSSGIREILNLALQKPGTIRLETGEPDFPPPPHVLDAYVEASRGGKNRYTVTEGIPALRQALARKLHSINHINRSADEILVTPGGIPALFLAFMGTSGSGSQILVPDPGWPDYLGGMVSLGIEPVPYPLSAPDYVPDLNSLTRLLTPRTRALVLNSPGNPTGRIVSEPLVRQLCQWAEEHDLWIISDEVYDQMVFLGSPISPARFAPERTLSAYSFSKTYAMTGWRLGYLAGPRPAVASLTRVAMGAWSSVSEPLQYAGLAALEGSQDVVDTMRMAYLRRRNLAMDLLASFGVTTSNPDGAFYLLADVRPVEASSRDFSLNLLRDAGVAVAPGSAFGQEAEGWVRISLASSDADLTEGLTRLGQKVRDGMRR